MSITNNDFKPLCLEKCGFLEKNNNSFTCIFYEKQLDIRFSHYTEHTEAIRCLECIQDDNKYLKK